MSVIGLQQAVPWGCVLIPEGAAGCLLLSVRATSCPLSGSPTWNGKCNLKFSSQRHARWVTKQFLYMWNSYLYFFTRVVKSFDSGSFARNVKWGKLYRKETFNLLSAAVADRWPGYHIFRPQNFGLRRWEYSKICSIEIMSLQAIIGPPFSICSRVISQFYQIFL